jgi:hypothetical protein
VIVPQVAAVLTITWYVVPWPRTFHWLSDLAVLLGVLITGAVWALAALIVQPTCTAERADPDTYGTLLGRLEVLEAQAGLSVSSSTSAPPVAATQFATADQAADVSPAAEDPRATAKRELARCGAMVRQLFDQPGVAWVLASGYVHVWMLLHTMDEALIELEPREILIRDALLDEARLAGSALDNRADLLEQLRLAVQHLGPDAAMYLAKQPPTGGPCPPPAAQQDAPSGLAAAAPAAANNAVTARQGETQARAILRTVRHAINEYRDTRRGGLVRARNQLMATVLVTGITVYLLLALAIALGAAKSAIVGAAAFFLVGAGVGLFNRLSAQSTSDNAVDDFGLSVARLTLTPVFSGLAAIGGVLLTALLFSTILAPSSATGASAHAAAASQSLVDIYNVGRFPFSLVVAATFGLTPGLFLAGLQQQSDRLKADLKSSQASSRG